MHNYRFLVFDIDNTLLDFEKSETIALKKTTEAFVEEPFREGATQSYHRINQELWKRLEEGKLESSAQINPLRFQQLSEEIPLLGDYNEAAVFYLEQLREQAFMMDGVSELLPLLKSAGYNLSLLTNGLHCKEDSKWQRIGFNDWFPLMLTSLEAGVSKPDPAFFEIHLERLGNPPREEVLMIGDSLKSDIAGAVAAGVGSCWFNPGGLPLTGEIKPDIEIRSWDDFLSVLEG